MTPTPYSAHYLGVLSCGVPYSSGRSGACFDRPVFLASSLAYYPTYLPKPLIHYPVAAALNRQARYRMIHPQRQTIVQQPASLLNPSDIVTPHRPALGTISLTSNDPQMSVNVNIYKGTGKHQDNRVKTPVPHLHSNLSNLALRANPTHL